MLQRLPSARPGRRLRLEGVQVAVHSTGGAGRRTFVLVHGLGASHRYLSGLQAALAPHGTVHAVDLPGFGGLPRPGHRLSVADLAAVVASTLHALEVTDAVLVGHSMGAQVVTELAVRRPDLVSHLVLVGPVTDPRRATVPRLAFDLTRDTLGEAPSGSWLVLVDYLRCGARWYLTQLPVMRAYRTEQRLPAVRVPTLVLRGSRDRVARRGWCRALAAAAPLGRLREIGGHRHLVQHTAPRRTAAAILDLLGAGA